MAVIELKLKPSDRDLRWFGFIVPVFFGLIGAAAHFRFDSPSVARVLWIAGVVLASAYFTVRPLRVPMYLGWMRLFFPLGWTVSQLVLVILYYLIVTPTALLLRLFRYDPLKRRLDRSAASYWIEYRTGRDPSRYLRQY